MKLYIAGGCGEHGRNCFLIEGNTQSFLVDCGMMAEEGEQGVPRLTYEQIESLCCVFLTHSHADHSGAIPWLLKQGYHGPIIAAQETLAQLPFPVETGIALETICPNRQGQYHGIEVEWGRSGHCRGSVWYHFCLEGKKLLFSGDYTEDTLVYAVDPIRGQYADLAVVDCAYGNQDVAYEERCSSLLTNAAAFLQKRPLVFPVPRFGRGIELLQLFYRGGITADYYGDAHFLTECERAEIQGYPEVFLAAGEEREGIIFLSNPQLRTESTRMIAEHLIERGAYGILTGTVEKGTYAAALLEQGKAMVLPYPVHLNRRQSQKLCSMNHFGYTVFYHSSEIKHEAVVVF